MTSPDYKDRIETELQDAEETLLRITRGAAGPKRQGLLYTVHYLWTEKGEQHAINYLLKFLIAACTVFTRITGTLYSKGHFGLT